MIEVRIDINLMQTHQHNIMHSILMLHMLREAGMPVIGKIVFNGPTRGTLIQTCERGLDGDTWIVRWYDDDEPTAGSMAIAPHIEHAGKSLVQTGSGRGYTWKRFENPRKKDRRFLMWHAESESYVETRSPLEVERMENQGLDDVTDNPEHEAAYKVQQENDW